jgi:hypothetical protein
MATSRVTARCLAGGEENCFAPKGLVRESAELAQRNRVHVNPKIRLRMMWIAERDGFPRAIATSPRATLLAAMR